MVRSSIGVPQWTLTIKMTVVIHVSQNPSFILLQTLSFRHFFLVLAQCDVKESLFGYLRQIPLTLTTTPPTGSQVFLFVRAKQSKLKLVALMPSEAYLIREFLKIFETSSSSL